MKELSHEQASSLFWINCIASVVLAVAIAALGHCLRYSFMNRS